ncbi:MAG: serine/threonine protein kinase [Coriobacteriia bacterium]|nr:serine/threonine protein kinase [Coriobacteriia bacterium]
MEQSLVLGRYRPLAELGSGGHGEVVLAYDTKMARRVAIKRLRLPVDGTGRPSRQAGLAEARTAAMLNHPHIVTVHEWDTDADEAFLIMEHVDGVSLADLLEARGAPLDLDEAAAVALALGSALRFAHENGVLHLDLKPENVLLSRDGRVKVADFGVAQLTGLAGSASPTGGTLGFMPPEQLRGGELDDRADEWAFAATLYEALTSAAPLASESLEGAVFKAEIAPVPAPSEFEPRVPPAIDEALLTALAPAPEDRFDDVSELTARLAPWLGDAAAGSGSLASAVDALLAEEEPAEEGAAGAWDVLARYSGGARRAAAALLGGWLAWGGLTALPLPSTAAAAAAALVALAGALAPGLGLALGLACLAAGLGTVSWLASATVVLLGGAWWRLLGRDGSAQALFTLAAPAMAALGAGPAAPLLAGFASPPLAAAASSAASAVAVMSVSAASGGTPPLLRVPPSLLADPVGTLGAAPLGALVADPGPLLVVAAWATAGATSSLLCSRSTRTGAWAGAVLGGVLMGAAYAIWAAMPAGFEWPDETVLRQLSASLIMVVLVAAAGPPARPEEEPLGLGRAR